jgi:hypothetical protein
MLKHCAGRRRRLLQCDATADFGAMPRSTDLLYCGCDCSVRLAILVCSLCAGSRQDRSCTEAT